MDKKGLYRAGHEGVDLLAQHLETEAGGLHLWDLRRLRRSQLKQKHLCKNINNKVFENSCLLGGLATAPSCLKLSKKRCIDVKIIFRLKKRGIDHSPLSVVDNFHF